MRKVSLALLFGLALAAGPTRAGDLVVKAAKVYTMTGPPLAPGMVHISDGKIVAVTPTLTPPADALVIDLGDGMLLPGLVDAYSQAGIDGDASELTREITPDFRVLSAIDWRSRKFREALAEGTTTLGLAPGTDNVFAGRACAVKTAGRARDQRVLAADTGLVLTLAPDPGQRNTARTRPDSIYVRQPTNRMGVVWMLRSTFDKARRDRSDELAPLREALAGKRRVLAVSRAENDILALLRLGEEFKFTPILVGGQDSYKVADRLAAAKVPVLLAKLDTAARAGPDGSDLVLNAAGALHQAGVPFAFTGGDLLEQARFAVRFGLPADAALRALTSRPAELLGLHDRVGTLAPGRDADLVALSGDPLELTSRIRWVMVAGTIYEKEE